MDRACASLCPSLKKLEYSVFEISTKTDIRHMGKAKQATKVFIFFWSTETNFWDGKTAKRWKVKKISKKIIQEEKGLEICVLKVSLTNPFLSMHTGILFVNARILSNLNTTYQQYF